jgi:ABC-type transport system involved in multi-copper enzyme maturation permease subunit
MASATQTLVSPAAIDRRFSTLRELTWDNPVLVKEFRTRMRGARAYWVLLAYVTLLTLVVGSTYLNWYMQTSTGGVSRQAASTTGRLLFQLLFAFQAGLVALITPAITAGTITIEREQQTYQMLATCGLRTAHIIWGKLLAAVAFVALLLTSSLPLVSLSFLLGGVSPGEVFGTYLSLALSAFVFGSIGILCSASMRVTAAATVATYAAVLLLFVVTVMLGVNAPGSDLPFRSVNAATAIYHSVDMEPFFGIRLPSWLIGVTMNLLMGLLFANLAMSKLEYFEDRRPLAVRGLATALWAAFLLFLTGNLFGQSGASWANSTSSAREFSAWTLAFYFGMLLLTLPIFTSGEWDGSGQWAVGSGQEEENNRGRAVHRPLFTARFVRGLLPHAMFRAELPAGAPLMALWLAIACAAVLGGFLVMGRPGLFPAQSLVLMLLMLVVTAAFGALANFLSVGFRDRKAAMVLTYLTIAACSLLPLFGFMTWEASGRSADPRLSWQFLYVTPFLAFAEIGANPGSPFWSNNPPMLLGQTPFWLVTGGIYGVLAAAFFSLTLRRIARGQKGAG